jgi:hypothetical protein
MASFHTKSDPTIRGDLILKTLVLTSVIILALSIPAAALAETRCGWVQNPTPGNWWLTDRDGEWTMMAQGSYEAPGMDNIGDISAGDYVATNGNYGYACGCMEVDTDRQGTITQIYSFRQLPMRKCTKDNALPAPE